MAKLGAERDNGTGSLAELDAVTSLRISQFPATSEDVTHGSKP
jgi:hypothetical protein